MRHRGGPTLLPAIAALVIGGAVLFFSEVTWLQMPAAVVMVVGIWLGVFAVATPDFLEADREEEGAD
jgi:hypothetical protein